MADTLIPTKAPRLTATQRNILQSMVRRGNYLPGTTAQFDAARSLVAKGLAEESDTFPGSYVATSYGETHIEGSTP